MEAALLDHEGLCLALEAQLAREHHELEEQHRQYQRDLEQLCEATRSMEQEEHHVPTKPNL